MPDDFHLCHQSLRLMKAMLAIIEDSAVILLSSSFPETNAWNRNIQAVE